MQGIRIRAAGLTDIPIVAHHRRSMFADMGRGTSGELQRMLETTKVYLETAMPSGEYVGWLAESAEGRVVAGAGMTISAWPGSPGDPTGRRGLVINVYTEPEFRRRGVARRLMETLIVWCREQGFHTISLHASEFGRALYEELGFRPTNEMRLQL